MPTLPATIALTLMADGSNIVASDPRNDFVAVQTAVNAIIAALSSGTAGQILQALTSTSVGWLTLAYCYATASGTSVPADTLTALVFDAETLDSDTMHDPVTNNTRITCKTAGTYLIAANAWSGATWPNGNSQFALYKNSSVISPSTVGAGPGDGFVGAGRGATFTLAALAATDYIEAKIQQHGGGTVTVQGAILAFKLPVP